jgi:hypothetical protein
MQGILRVLGAEAADRRDRIPPNYVKHILFSSHEGM